MAKVKFNIIFCSLTAMVSFAAHGYAQDSDNGGAVGATGPNPDQGLVVADWYLYPSLSAGAVFNDNVFHTKTDKKRQVGARLQSSFEAYRDAGVHKTNIYGSLDLQSYSGVSTSKDIQGNVGFAHSYEAQRDLTLRLNGDYTRQNGIFGNGSGVSLNGSAVPGASAFSGQPFNQYTGGFAIEKTFGKGFLNLISSVQDVQYDGAAYKSQNGASYNAGVRAGYNITPMFAAFVEPTVQWHAYNVGGLNTRGYRVVAGLSTQQIGLVHGEIYGGFQSQSGSSLIGGSVNAPTFGARLFYDPTRYINITASVDQDLGASVPVSLLAQYTKTSRATLTGKYSLSPYWSAVGRFGFSRTSYDLSKVHDDVMSAGAGLSYTFWRNIAIALDYQHLALDSHDSASSYKQNLYTIGVNYRY